MTTPPNLLDDSLERPAIWESIQSFASWFLHPFTPENQFSSEDIAASERRLGIRLPRALAEFYQRFGRARLTWSAQDEWLRPEGLKLEKGILRFYIECQGCWVVGIREDQLALDDPPVVWSDHFSIVEIQSTSQFQPLCRSVSVFALNTLAYVSKFAQRGDVIAIGIADDSDVVLAELTRHYAPCRLQETWVWGPVTYFQSADTFIEVSHLDGHIYPIFLTEQATSRFCEIADRLPFTWQEPPQGPR